jgi:hypothetical protein
MKMERIALIFVAITSLALCYLTYSLKKEVEELSYDIYRLQTDVDSIKSDLKYLKVYAR